MVPTIGNKIAEEIDDELHRAVTNHKPLNSAHEGWAVILEEVEELWEEIKKRRSMRDLSNMRSEAIQIAAMAIRFVKDVCEKKES
jgi:glutamyl-tRNA reductase